MAPKRPREEETAHEKLGAACFSDTVYTFDAARLNHLSNEICFDNMSRSDEQVSPLIHSKLQDVLIAVQRQHTVNDLQVRLGSPTGNYQVDMSALSMHRGCAFPAAMPSCVAASKVWPSLAAVTC